jgi:serine/threonine protein phosphatase PrpC
MSRSFGDNVSKAVGVTCDPEVMRMKLDRRDRFVLVASDGVWEFITNQ